MAAVASVLPSFEEFIQLSSTFIRSGQNQLAYLAAVRRSKQFIEQVTDLNISLCSGRGIPLASTLLSQFAVSLIPSGTNDDQVNYGIAVSEDLDVQDLNRNVLHLSYVSDYEKNLESSDNRQIQLAICYLLSNEFERCIHVLSPADTPSISSTFQSNTSTIYPAKDSSTRPTYSQRSLFISLYSRFALGERKRDEQSLGKDFLADAFLVNEQVKYLISILEKHLSSLPIKYSPGFDFKKIDPMFTSSEIIDESDPKLRYADPFLYYLLGLCYNEAGLKNKAISSFITSLQIYPYFWSSWKELITLLYTRNKFLTVLDNLPRGNFLFDIFLLHYIATHDTFPEYLEPIVDHLDYLFPGNPVIVLQHALVYYRRSHPDASEHFFERYRTLDPFSFEYLDAHSNVLFVRNDMVKLSSLAKDYFEQNRYKPEACVAVGNYYSLRREHSQAIQFFRRAIRLRHNFPEAWVMIGHEHVEVKHPNAALEAYRRAADLAPWDYKAWYGMGSILQTLGNVSLALPYYKRAIECKPNDSRIWIRIAGAYQALGDIQSSNEAMERAKSLSDSNKESIFS